MTASPVGFAAGMNVILAQKVIRELEVYLIR